MSMHSGLLDAIRAVPDDDEPRLILADWLEDHDEPERAEFIRLQCVLARLPAYHDLRPELEARERGLLLLHEAEWVALPQGTVAEGRLRRGFLDTLAIPARLLVRAPEAFLGSGTVRQLTLDIEDFSDLRGVAALPHLRSVRVLRLTGTRLHRAGLAALADSPHLRQLTGLHLRFDNVARGALRRVLSAWPALRDLELTRCGLYPDDLAAVLPTAPCALERLALDIAPFGDAGATLLANAVHLDHLRELSLTNVGLTDAGVTALVGARFAPGLERLNLAVNPHVAAPPSWLMRGGFPSLRILDLRGGSFTWPAPDALDLGHPTLRELSLYSQDLQAADLPPWLRFPALEVLDLQCAQALGIELLDALTASSFLTRLRRLRIQGVLEVDAFARLLSGPNAANWRALDLFNASLTNGLRPLFAGRYRPTLARLVLTRCELYDADAAALARCEWLSDLRELGLSNNYLRDAGAAAIATSPYLKRLVSLDLSRNGIRSVAPFVGTYLANPAILNVADNCFGDESDELLRAGVEVMRRVSVAPVLALLREGDAS